MNHKPEPHKQIPFDDALRKLLDAPPAPKQAQPKRNKKKTGK